MATYSNGYRVPEAGDPNAVPADLVAFGATIVPAMTTAEIDALSWARKPAKWQAFDTTKSKLVRSTGAAMVEIMDATGGTITGDVTVAGIAIGAAGSSGNRTLDVSAGGFNLRLKAGTTILTVPNSGAATLSRETQSGDSDETLVTKGYADDIGDMAAAATARVAGGVLSGTTDASANIALVLPVLPSGATGWAISVHAHGPYLVRINNLVGSLGSLKVYSDDALFKPATNEAVAIYWTAVAY